MTPHNENGPLSCPYCGCYYLHLLDVEVFSASASGDTGVHVTVQGTEVRLTPDPPRTFCVGAGVRLTFWCAWCPDPVALLMTEEGGQTIQVWERVVTQPDPDAVYGGLGNF